MASRHGRPAGSGVVWPSAKMVYALRACAVLAPAYPGRRLKAAEIARQGKVPVQFLSRILGELRDADLVDARRGYCGGYVLRRDPRGITVAELAQAVDGDGLFVPVPRHRRNPPLAFVDAPPFPSPVVLPLAAVPPLIAVAFPPLPPELAPPFVPPAPMAFAPSRPAPFAPNTSLRLSEGPPPQPMPNTRRSEENGRRVEAGIEWLSVTAREYERSERQAIVRCCELDAGRNKPLI